MRTSDNDTCLVLIYGFDVYKLDFAWHQEKHDIDVSIVRTNLSVAN